MTNRDFILAPTSVDVSIRLDAGHSMLNSLSLLSDIDNYTGMDEWLYEINRTLPAARLQRNGAFMEIYVLQLLRYDKNWDDLHAVADFLDTLDPYALIDGYVNLIADWIASKNGPDAPAPDALRDDYDLFREHMTRLQAQKDMEGKEEDLRLFWEMMQTPEDTQAQAVQHLRDMWDDVLKNEWARRLPLLQETVAAFQKLDYSDKGALEITRIITGRDLSSTPLAEKLQKLENAQQLVFVPNPHIGPYVGIIESESMTRVYFRPRMPDGVFHQSPAIDRSELLVRLNALADDTRLRVLELFTEHEELCATDVIQMLDLSQSAASRHLRQLTATGYLTERRRESAKCYTLNTDRVEGTLHALRAFLLSV